MSEFAGRAFCITGNLENFATKAEAYEEIIRRGGNAAKTLTPGCDFLVLGAKGNENYAFANKGNKQVLAEEWMRRGRAIRIITENQLIALIEASDEVDVSERGEMLSRSPAYSALSHEQNPKHRRSAISHEQTGGLECSFCFHDPDSEVRQVLRVIYESSPLPREPAQECRLRFKQLRKEGSTHWLRSSVRTEVLPVSWSLEPGSDGQDRLMEDEVVMWAGIVCILDGEPSKAAGREMAQEIKDYLVRSGLGGRLSLRIWNASHSYAQFWLNKLGG